MATEFDKELINVINAILVSRNNILHPRIISPKQVISELKHTLLRLPALTSYVARLNSENYQLLANVMELRVIRFNNRLIFVMENPWKY